MKYSLKKDGERLLSKYIRVRDFLNIATYVGYKNPATGKKITAQDLAQFDVVDVNDKLLELINGLEKEFECDIKLTPHGGYRPAKPINLNTAVGGANGSTHKTGKGADILLSKGNKPLDVPTMAVATEHFMYKNGIEGGVGVYAKNNKHFHIDTRGSWSAWYCSYSGAGTPAQGGRPCVFKIGNKSAGIVLIQRKLKSLGYDCGTADGTFGNKTAVALARFQRDNSLTGDGIYGSATNKKMGVLPW